MMNNEINKENKDISTFAFSRYILKVYIYAVGRLIFIHFKSHCTKPAENSAAMRAGAWYIYGACPFHHVCLR